MLGLEGTPYFVDATAARGVAGVLADLGTRVDLLRRQGTLTPETLRDYYGEKRFSQVAESNAIEGSPLSIGETELAIVKGITISGHDPGWSRDARDLDKALMELAVMARTKSPTDIAQVKKLHELVLGARPSAGNFRNEAIRITGSEHRPPERWQEIMTMMEQWEGWSVANAGAPPLLRAAVLHSWLTHIHPFLDGNGRSARAIANLELVRAGYPPIIVRRQKDRERYIEALHASDNGDLGGVIELFLERENDALRDLERSAKARQGYDVHEAAIRKAQENQVAVWNAAVVLLAERIRSELESRKPNALSEVLVWRSPASLDVDDYRELCLAKPISQSRAFRIECGAPGLKKVSRLAWAGFRSADMLSHLDKQQGPSLFWSRPTGSYPPWQKVELEAPACIELTLTGDSWSVLDAQRSFRTVAPSSAAQLIAQGLLALVAAGQG